MPLLFQKKFRESGWIAAWKTTEKIEQLLNQVELSPTEKLEFAKIGHDGRKVEWLGMRTLLRTIEPEIDIKYRESGQPYSIHPRGNISLSHSGNIVSAVYHPTEPAGIDIQIWNNKLNVIRDRFVRQDEKHFFIHGRHTEFILAIWCCKEALYKCYGTGISFREQMKILPFQCLEQETVNARVYSEGGFTEHELIIDRWEGCRVAYVSK